MASLKECGFIAIDQGTVREPFQLARSLVGSVAGLKLEDKLSEDNIKRLKDMGHRVFADAKIHRASGAIAAEVVRWAKAGADYITVDASLGEDALREAQSAYTSETNPDASIGDSHAGVLALTVLTSMDEAQCRWSYRSGTRIAVYRFGDAGIRAGVCGLVCSPLEPTLFKGDPKRKLLKVFTPGIISEGFSPGRHKRYGTPAFALSQGADCLVLGGEVTRAPDGDWLGAIERIDESIAHLP